MNNEEKANAYDKALALIKDCIPDKDGYVTVRPCDIFSELKENEDERIRKALIEIIRLSETESLRAEFGITKEDIINWLEKQGETWIKTLDDANVLYQMSMNEEMTEDAAKLTIKGLEELHLWQIVKEYIVKQGEPKWKPSKEQIIALRWVLNNIPYNIHKEEISGLLEQLEKQGNKPKGKTALEAIQEEKVDNANKVEPNFHEGDWIIDKSFGNVKQIKEFDSDEKVWFTDATGTFVEFLQGYRPWTIQDAKDGDVLSYMTDDEELWIMIYRSLYRPYEGNVHYHALLINKDFSSGGTCCIDIDGLKPATKEQREMLFKSMADAGYKWDAEKLESKKIENSPQILSNSTKIGKNLWSDKDEELLQHCCGAVAAADYYSMEDKEEMENWLKSLKKRMEIEL